MKIKEQELRPNPGGFGWGQYERTRELAAGEAVPAGALAADDAADVTDWVSVGSLMGAAVGAASGRPDVPPTSASSPPAIPAADPAEGK